MVERALETVISPSAAGSVRVLLGVPPLIEGTGGAVKETHELRDGTRSEPRRVDEREFGFRAKRLTESGRLRLEDATVGSPSVETQDANGTSGH